MDEMYRNNEIFTLNSLLDRKDKITVHNPFLAALGAITSYTFRTNPLSNSSKFRAKSSLIAVGIVYSNSSI